MKKYDIDDRIQDVLRIIPKRGDIRESDVISRSPYTQDDTVGMIEDLIDDGVIACTEIEDHRGVVTDFLLSRMV